MGLFGKKKNDNIKKNNIKKESWQSDNMVDEFEYDDLDFEEDYYEDDNARKSDEFWAGVAYFKLFDMLFGGK